MYSFWKILNKVAYNNCSNDNKKQVDNIFQSKNTGHLLTDADDVSFACNN